MRYIDFAVQTLFLLAGFLSPVWVVTFDAGTSWLLPVLAAQMYLGIWQMLSCLIALLAKKRAYAQKRIHFLISVSYLATLILAWWTGAEAFYNFDNSLFLVYLIAPAWMLAIYYYILTWRVAFAGYKKTSNFLPHINF